MFKSLLAGTALVILPLAASAADLPARAMAPVTGEIVELVMYTPPPGIAWDDATYTGSAYPVYGWAACLVDVSVDLDSYEVKIDRCVQAVDVGKAIRMMNGSRKLSNCAASTRKMTISAKRKVTASVLPSCCNCRLSPWKS